MIHWKEYFIPGKISQEGCFSPIFSLRVTFLNPVFVCFIESNFELKYPWSWFKSSVELSSMSFSWCWISKVWQITWINSLKKKKKIVNKLLWLYDCDYFTFWRRLEIWEAPFLFYKKCGTTYNCTRNDFLELENDLIIFFFFFWWKWVK